MRQEREGNNHVFVLLQKNPAGDRLIDRARAFARQNPGSDATNRFLRELVHDAALAALYSEVPDRGNFHAEVGRQVRHELAADVFRSPSGRPCQIRIKDGPHTAYTPLNCRRRR
jgi:hypothetical protein